MFYLLAELSKQELEKIYELTYKYGWLVSEERQKDQLSDRAYMEKARIEGELEPLINNGLEELAEVFLDYIESYGADEVDRYINKGFKIKTFDRFLTWFAFESSFVDKKIDDEIYDYAISFIINNVSLIDILNEMRRIKSEHFNGLTYDYHEPFVNNLLDLGTENDRTEIYSELDMLEEEYPNYPSSLSFASTNEDLFIQWLGNTYENTEDKKVIGNIYTDAIDDGEFDNLVKGSLLDKFKQEFKKDIYPNLPSLKWGNQLVNAYNDILDGINAKNLSDKIYAFQLGLTTTHESGPMASYLLGYEDSPASGTKAKRFLNQLSSDKYVSKWNKELQQSTGIRVGASLHLKIAIDKLALISNPVNFLKNYLTMSDVDKGKELALFRPTSFLEWYINSYQAFESLDEEAEELEKWERIIEEDPYKILEFPEQAFSEFYDKVLGGYGHFFDDPYSPSFLHMRFDRIVKNQWLIHFTNDAMGIQSSGFEYGYADLGSLGLTTSITQEAKETGGYNFAFLLTDYLTYGRNYRGGSREWKYGNEAVMFKASGIRVYHYGDDEYQVIFYGDTAKDIVPLYQSDGAWVVGEHPTTGEPLKEGALETVVDWVVTNYDQYRNIL